MLNKKQIAIVLSFLLLVSNMGLAFNAVFCCEKLVAISSSTASDNDCHIIKKKSTSCCDIIIENENCCATKKIDIKPTVSQLLLKDIKLSFENFSLFVNTDFVYFSILNKPAIKKETFLYVFNSSSPPLYKLLCRFVTYG